MDNSTIEQKLDDLLDHLENSFKRTHQGTGDQIDLIVRSIYQLGRAAHEPMTHKLHHGGYSTRVRSQIIDILASVIVSSPEVVDGLRTQYTDYESDSMLLAKLSRILVEQDDKGVYQHHLGTLQTGEDYEAEAAVSALAANDDGLNLLISEYDNLRPRVQAAILTQWQLRRKDDASILPYLIKGLSSESDTLRREVATTLRTTTLRDDSIASNLLEATKKEQSEETLGEIIYAIKTHPHPDAIPVLMNTLMTNTSSITNIVVEVLESLSGKGWINDEHLPALEACCAKQSNIETPTIRNSMLMNNICTTLLNMGTEKSRLLLEQLTEFTFSNDYELSGRVQDFASRTLTKFDQKT